MLKVNEQKQKRIEVEGRSYDRFAIPTPVIAEGDDLDALLTQLVLPELEADDLVFISEKMVACTQGRAIPLSAIVPGRLARLLSRFVTKTPRGIGLGMPETMQMAIEECGVIRILFAALAGALGRLSGQKGWFYQVAGKKASTIDGPCGYTLPPYNHYVVLGPSDPQAVAGIVPSGYIIRPQSSTPTITALRFWGCGPRPCPDAGWPPHCGIIRWGRAASERRLGFCARLAKGKLKSARSWTR